MKISRIPEQKALMRGDKIVLLAPTTPLPVTDRQWPAGTEVIYDGAYNDDISYVIGPRENYAGVYANLVYNGRLGI